MRHHTIREVTGIYDPWFFITCKYPFMTRRVCRNGTRQELWLKVLSQPLKGRGDTLEKLRVDGFTLEVLLAGEVR